MPFIKMIFTLITVVAVLALLGYIYMCQIKLRRIAKERGWSLIRNSFNNQTISGTSDNVLWQIECLNNDLIINWQSKHISSSPFLFCIYRAHLGIDPDSEEASYLRTGKAQTWLLGPEAFSEKYVIITDLPEQQAAAYITPRIQAALLDEDIIRDRVYVHYYGNELYVKTNVSSADKLFDVRIIDEVIHIGTTVVTEWQGL